MIDAAEAARRADVIGFAEGRRVVIAGPGAGKTELLVRRLEGLLDRGAPAREVLTLVFNRRAAAELRRRLASARPDRGLVELRIATFHSFALALVDRHWRRAALAGRPALLPSDEQRAAVRALLGVDPDPDGWGVDPDVRRSPSFGAAVADAVLRAQEQLRGPDDLGPGRPAAAFLRRYLEALASRAEVDFAGVLAAAARLCADPAVRAALGVRHLLVDEYQDANVAQAALVDELARDCATVVVVGDPFQAIYGFRGASVQMLEEAQARLWAQRVTLTHGFRCAQPVVDAAVALVAADPRLPPRPALVGRVPDEGGPEAPAGVAAAVFAHRGDELDWVAAHVRRLGSEVGWDRVAVLCRSLRPLRGPLAAALTGAGVPHRFAGGRVAIRHPWVARLVDLLEVVDGTGAGSASGSTAAVLEAAALSPLVGGEPLALRDVFRQARRGDDPERRLRAFAEVPAGADDPAAGGRDAVAGLLAAVRAARGAARRGGDAATVAWVLWSRLPAATALAAGAADPAALAPTDVDGTRAVGAWLETLARFAERHPGAGVDAYLTTLDDEADDDTWLADREEAAPAVAVMTVHQAKGLEFDHVVVPALEEGRFPAAARGRGLLGPFGLTADDPGPEERRLLYVALTRARQTAMVTATVGTEDRAEASPSRFLSDLAPHLRRPEELFPPPAADPHLGPLAGVDTLADAGRVWGAALRRARGDPTVEAVTAAAGLQSAGAALPWVPEPALAPARRLRDGDWLLSASALNSYLGCARQFLFGRVLRLAPFEQGPSAAFGTAVHAAVQAWLEAGEDPDADLLRAHLEERFDELAVPVMTVGVQREAFRRKLPTVAQNVARMIGQVGEPVLVEQELRVDHQPGVRLVAKPDVVARGPDGLEIVDWKTGDRKGQHIPDDVQLSVYYHVVRAVLGEPVARLRRAHVSDGKWAEQAVGADHDDHCAGVITGAVTGILAEEFPIGDDPPCRTCPVVVLCLGRARGQEPPW